MEELTRLKNTATIITYPLLNISGIPVSGATALDSEWDGWSDTVIPNGFTDCTNEATEIGSTGIYYLSLTQPEMNNDYVYVQTKSVPCLTQHILIRTIPGDSYASVQYISGIVDNIHTDANTIVGKLPTNFIMGSTVLTAKDDDIDNIYNIVNNASYGNSALSGLVANNHLDLYTIKSKLPTNYIMGSPDAADKIVVIPQLHIPSSFDLANTATVRFAMTISSNMGAVPTTGQITPGTVSIYRKAKGATTWTTIVSGEACLELAGFIYYDEVFDAGTGYAEGDSIRLWFQNQAVVINGVTYQITGSNGLFAYTYIRETGVKEMYAKLPTNFIMGSSDVDNHDTDIDSILTYSQSISGIVSNIHLDTDSVETGISNISGIVSTINTNTKKLLYGDAVWYSDNGSAGTDIGVNGTMYNQSNSPADMRILATALNLKKYRLTIDSAATGLVFDDDYTGWEFAGVHNISWIDINGKIPSGCHFENLQVFGVMGTPSTPGIYAGGDFYNCLLYTLENVNSITVFNCTFAESIDFVDNHSSGFAMMMIWDCRNDIGESNNPWIDWNVDASVLNFYAYALGYRGDIHLNGMTDGEIIFDGDGELTIDSTCISGTAVVSGNVKVTNNSSGVVVTYKQIIRDANGYVYLANDSIKAVTFDESTAYPIKSDDSGLTKIFRTGADADTGETLSDQLDSISGMVSDIHLDTSIVDDIYVDTQYTKTVVDSIKTDTQTTGGIRGTDNDDLKDLSDQLDTVTSNTRSPVANFDS